MRTNPIDISIDGTDFHDTRALTTVPELAYGIILGKDWLDDHDPSIDWPNNKTPQATPEILSVPQFHTLLRKLGPNDFLGAILPNEPTPETEFKTTTAESDAADKLAYSKLSPELQPILNKYSLVFSPFEGLPPFRPTDMRIETDPSADKSPPFRPIYTMSDEGSKALQEELQVYPS
ncbi:hypothetical protein HDU98_000452 [Podochytrium sp. JEL0797]|nr:hypothetical protein HDU98_000452 [Podochytrium sp. JEL0797]